MAKEMMIVFVYDTTRCCKEDDDPADAVMYFHPAWVSPTQRLALAGQLMGVYQFMTMSFSTPNMISLQGGKFVLKKFRQYLLAVGTDRNIHDWILERRADILESLLKFFHRDFNTISMSVNNDRNKFTEKLYQMFETYLPILQYNASLFSNVPLLKLPRSASNIFLDAMQILQYCQETSGIMGGALFFNNKVIASQLSPQMTKHLVITDPYRIKAPAERIPTTFHLPLGVQLLRIYFQHKQCTKMLKEANRKRSYSSYTEQTHENGHKKEYFKPSAKEPSISMMKRDTSRIFTVPEEGELEPSHYKLVRGKSPSPPKRIDEIPKCQNPLTPSVCSTPLKDVIRFLHGNTVSICCSAEESGDRSESKGDARKNSEKVENADDIPDVVKKALRSKRLNKLRNAPVREKLEKELDKRSSSLSDLSTSLDSHCVALRPYGLGLPKPNRNVCDVYHPGGSEKIVDSARFFNTITDPCYPVFRSNGFPVSGFLYDQYIANRCTDKKADEEKRNETQKGQLSLSKINSKNQQRQKGDVASEKSDYSSVKTNVQLEVRSEINKNKLETYRRSMSLPLKPLNALDGDDRRKSASEVGGIFELPQRRKLEGLQLTPLMSKLSLLADERTSGFCSRETTPSEFRDLSSTLSIGTSRNLSKNQSEGVKDFGSDEDELVEDWTSGAKDTDDFVKGELFLCGHQNMVLTLVMEDGTAKDPELVHSLWKTCVDTLSQLETRLQQCLDPLPLNESKELYSVLSVDSDWDTVHRSGLWGVTELDMVSVLHERLKKGRNITDIVVRTEDTVVYGNQCGKMQVFYQQGMPSNTSGGLPTPADLMGTVPLKAKRRLEKDHEIIIL